MVDMTSQNAKTVLIVEDDSESAVALISLLQNHCTAPLCCHAVRSIRSAQLWLENNPQLALLVTDMHLPADEQAVVKLDEVERRRRDLHRRARMVRMSGEDAKLFLAEADAMDAEIDTLIDPIGGLRILEWLAERHATKPVARSGSEITDRGDLALPVIVTTAAGSPDMSLGVHPTLSGAHIRYLQKPFHPGRLLSLIESVLAE